MKPELHKCASQKFDEGCREFASTCKCRGFSVSTKDTCDRMDRNYFYLTETGYRKHIFQRFGTLKQPIFECTSFQNLTCNAAKKDFKKGIWEFM